MSPQPDEELRKKVRRSRNPPRSKRREIEIMERDGEEDSSEYSEEESEESEEDVLDDLGDVEWLG